MITKKLVVNSDYQNIAEEMAKSMPAEHSVMSPELVAPLLATAMTEDELKKQGYKPVSSNKLLWYK